MILTEEVAVTSSAAAVTTVETDNQGGHSVMLTNTGATTVYVGGAGVTTSNGTPVASGERFSADLRPDEHLYVIAVATGTVRVLRTGA